MTSSCILFRFIDRLNYMYGGSTKINLLTWPPGSSFLRSGRSNVFIKRQVTHICEDKIHGTHEHTGKTLGTYFIPGNFNMNISFHMLYNDAMLIIYTQSLFLLISVPHERLSIHKSHIYATERNLAFQFKIAHTAVVSG